MVSTATSSGGYGTAANVWSQKSQRGFDNSRTSARVEPYETPEVKERGREGADESQTGLVDQSTTGGDLAGEIQDAKQGGEGRWPDESRIL